MNKISKKLLSLLVVFSMIFSMFAMTSVTTFAEEKLPQTITLVAYPKATPEFLTSLSSKASALKTSNTSVVSVKQTKYTYGSQAYYRIVINPAKLLNSSIIFPNCFLLYKEFVKRSILFC